MVAVPPSKPINYSIMKLYIVYFRTFENSPEVEIRCATTNKELAKEALKKAKKEAREWMKDVNEDSGDWADAHMETFDLTEERKAGDKLFLLIETVWCECVETNIWPFLCEINADTHLEIRRQAALKDFPGLTPFNEDDTILDSTHLEDPEVAVDVYFSIEEVVTE